MSIKEAEEIFERYLNMQDVHMETLENNISKLENGKPVISDLDYLTIERENLYSEIKIYFEKEFPNEDLTDIDTKTRLENLSEKLQFIMEREDKLKNLVLKNSKLLSIRLGKLRNGKNALNAYNRAAENI
eukprot:gnl/Chilomastix_cuspidata/9321.p4 GENE.gnl/Chilomastix_cuspidata/9321~~gnl/Chilomastix_cuspidata/9321.p4  ORF type:complete len:130 (-),score=26.70 gnl/Chilomastix_cuspidata/9321:598-987(-)